MDAETRKSAIEENPAARLAVAWHLAGGGHGLRNMVVLPYRDRLLLLGRYLQQLVMESLGKAHDVRGGVVHQGLTVYGNKGSTDQHAYVQQLREGPDDFFVTFLASRKDAGLGGRGAHAGTHATAGENLEIDPGVTSGDYLLGFLLGTREALEEKGRPSIFLSLPDVSERTLGALIALYERAVGLYAALIGINAYHQPGVEAGKRAAARALETQARALEALASAREALAAPEVAARLGDETQAEMVFHLLEHLAANGRIRAVPGARWWEARFARK